MTILLIRMCLDDASLLFSHLRFREEVLLQGRNLRDAASHRDGLDETFLRQHALNGILLTIGVADREQAIDIKATIETFLTGRTKYQALTRLRAVCNFALTIDRFLWISWGKAGSVRPSLCAEETKTFTSAKRGIWSLCEVQLKVCLTRLPRIPQP